MRVYTEQQKKQHRAKDKISRARRRSLSAEPVAPIPPRDPITNLRPDSPLAPALREAALLAQERETKAAVESWQSALSSDENKHKSIKTMQYLRDNAISESVRFRAAKDLLDRAAADLRKQPTGKTVVNLFSDASTEELMGMLRRLPPSETGPAKVVDVSPA